MKQLTLIRVSKSNKCCMGVLLGADGIPILITLERPWRQNEPFISCIPTGAYICSPTTRKKNGDVFEVKDVPGRTDILFHSGNVVTETEGCILPGLTVGQKDGNPAVFSSRDAMKVLSETVNNEDFELIIGGGTWV